MLLFLAPVLCSCLKGQRPAGVITVRSGEQFTVALKANMTTGYAWQFLSPPDKNMLQLVSSEYLVDNPELTGSEGRQVWIFKALKPGKTNIYLRYVRPWEKNNPPADQASFEVSIKN